jgi:hypothetical protein
MDGSPPPGALEHEAAANLTQIRKLPQLQQRSSQEHKFGKDRTDSIEV